METCMDNIRRCKEAENEYKNKKMSLDQEFNPNYKTKLLEFNIS